MIQIVDNLLSAGKKNIPEIYSEVATRGDL